jgi:DltD protein
MTPFQQSKQSNRQPARLVLLAVLLTANVLLYALWPWLRQMPLAADSSQPFVLRNVIRNEQYLERFFDGIRENRKILFLGTSESMPPYNLAAQLNAAGPNGPYLAALSKGGNSPIHSALAIARAKREGLQFPPIVLVINPVYFTESYDIIDDGWMSDMVRSPVFLQVNHRDVRDYLSKEVQQAYDGHFMLKRLLYPATIQEYLSNLLYLRFHQPAAVAQDKVLLRMPVYKFNGSLPSYDNEKNVWPGEEAPDRFSKSRWQVNSVEESVNLKGLASIITILEREPAPVLLLFLPANRNFYQYHDLDVEEIDRKYRDIRNVLQKFSRAENIYLLDLYDVPLRFGFRDRMHMDEYGFFQLASHIVRDETYLRFLKAVNAYYNTSAGAQTVAHQEPAEHLKVRR